MDTRRLGTILSRVGVGIVALAIVWWFSYYSQLLQFMEQRNATLPFECLFATTTQCAFMGGMQSLFQNTIPYSPAVFWIGAVLTAIGLIIVSSMSKRPRISSSRPAIPTAIQPSIRADLADEVIKLARLHSEGKLTDIEFQQLKSRLVDTGALVNRHETVQAARLRSLKDQNERGQITDTEYEQAIARIKRGILGK